MVKYYHKKEIAYRFTLDIEGNVQEYALSLLNIINHTRVYPDTFYKVENTDSNIVYVTCDKGDRDSVRDYLENFGTIKSEGDINWFIISAQYDKAGWQELFEYDYEKIVDVDFAVEID